MTLPILPKPILLIGAGALGSSILRGFRVQGHVKPSEVMILDLLPGDEAQAYMREGAHLNPSPEDWKLAKTVILAVKPQGWHAVAQILSGNLDPNAVLISVMAGVQTQNLKHAFPGHPIARVMPTTGVATGRGVASIYAEWPDALNAARAMFEPMAAGVLLKDENLIDSATAVSGSGPAYVYAFVRALEKAALETGLDANEARILARATLVSAANLLDQSGAEPDDLIRSVASPGGTTEAALKVLCYEGSGIDELMSASVRAAHKRAKELG